MKYKKNLMAILVLSMLGFSGCAESQIPEMTAEEMQAVGEFVAYTLMKYDVGQNSRLMELPPEEMEEEHSEVKVPTQTPAPEASVGMDPVDDTPVTTAPGAELTVGENTYSAEEVMGLPEGVVLEFAGKVICDSYPDESDAFAVSATQGKKLLILKFSITNTMEQETKVDLFSSQTTYRIAVDGERSRRALTTMLPNDLAFYVDTLPAGASAEAVLVMEVDADRAETIDTVTVQMKNESKSHTIQLSDDV